MKITIKHETSDSDKEIEAVLISVEYLLKDGNLPIHIYGSTDGYVISTGSAA